MDVYFILSIIIITASAAAAATTIICIEYDIYVLILSSDENAFQNASLTLIIVCGFNLGLLGSHVLLTF